MARFLTKTEAGIVTTGVSIDFTNLDTDHPCQLILYPGRTGDIRLQWASGALDTEGGDYIVIPQDAGGDDPLVLYYDKRALMPKYMASESGTVSCRYSVGINASGLLPGMR